MIDGCLVLNLKSWGEGEFMNEMLESTTKKKGKSRTQYPLLLFPGNGSLLQDCILVLFFTTNPITTK